MTTDTPARQPQDPLYHIRESELKYILSHNMEDDNSGIGLLISSRTHEELEYFSHESRPHTSPPAQDEQLQISDIIKDLEQSLKFYKDRINYLQCWQSSMRDPERKIVCDILANGFTLTTKEEIDNAGAEAAKAAREQVLKDLYEYAKDNPNGQGFASGVDEYISLRAQQEPEPARPSAPASMEINENR